MQDRRITSPTATCAWDGIPTSAKQTEAGRCVKTMVRTFPMRRASDAAKRMEMAAMMEVVKKSDPMAPEERAKRRWK